MDRPSLEHKEIVSHNNKPYGETDIGMMRMENQDDLIVIDEVIGRFRQRVFAVADGVGGESGGKEASKTLIREINSRIRQGINIDTQELFQINEQINVGGTTLVLAQSFGEKNSFQIMSVGDSSAYILDSERGQMPLITRRDEAMREKNGRKKMVVTQILGPKNISASLRDPYIYNVRLEPNQSLILATDGLTDYIDHDKIKVSNIVSLKRFHKNDNKAFVKELIRMSNTIKGHDNITVISIPYESE